MKKAACKQVEFQLAATPGSEVVVAGTFNNWDTKKNPMKANPDDGLYRTVIAIPPGNHEYKFVVNGKWCVDPNCTESIPNCQGSSNSVIRVQDRRSARLPFEGTQSRPDDHRHSPRARREGATEYAKRDPSP